MTSHESSILEYLRDTILPTGETRDTLYSVREIVKDKYYEVLSDKSIFVTDADLLNLTVLTPNECNEFVVSTTYKDVYKSLTRLCRLNDKINGNDVIIKLVYHYSLLI